MPQSGTIERRIADEQQTFAQPLRALIRRAPVVCAAHRTLAEAAALMRSEGVGSLVIVDDASRPVGVVTTHDLVGVLADGRGGQRVDEAMSRNPIGLPGHAFAYEAAMTMSAHRIRHVLVIENERLLGVVSERDLFALQRLGMGELTMEIRSAASPELLAGLAAEIRRLSVMLVHQGVAPEALTHFVSVLNDRLLQRVVEIVRKAHTLDRVSWCWIAFGSEGRLEQTFSTDQDNGLIFACHDGSAQPEARERLLVFARAVNEALAQCGFPLCRGNVMASNPELCLTLDEWKRKMAGWIDVSSPKALLDAAICFDFRAVHGDASLAWALREWTAPRMRSNPAFLRHLAQASLEARPAIGRLGGFATEDAPGSPHTINLKLHGARIFVDAARVLALAQGLAETNTAERLRAVRSATGHSEADTEAMVDAFHLIQALRLRVQAERLGDAHCADEAHNRIDPARLNTFEQAALKEAMRLARELQVRVALDYQI